MDANAIGDAFEKGSVVDVRAIMRLADQLYDMAEHAGGGDHNLQASVMTGSFDVIAFLDTVASALPIIIALIKALIGQPAVTPKT